MSEATEDDRLPTKEARNWRRLASLGGVVATLIAAATAYLALRPNDNPPCPPIEFNVPLEPDGTLTQIYWSEGCPYVVP